MPLQTAVAIEAAFAPSTDQVYMVLATISHEQLSEPLYIANNRINVQSRGQTFIGFPFAVRLVTDDELPPRGEIEVQNVGGATTGSGEDPDQPPVQPRISQIILPLRGPVFVKFEIVLLFSPDIVEKTYDELVLRDIEADGISVRASITGRFQDREPATKYRIKQETFPGVYV